MRKRKKGAVLNGWLVLDKPPGMTSNQALGAVKRLLDPRKAGHAGTLDPLATGVLPIALGEATKTVPFAVDGLKTYVFAVRWGAQTDTDDAEGKAVATSAARPSLGEVEAVLHRYAGVISQTPPAFSAIKIAGERAYDLARSGVEVDIAPRAVTVESLRVLDVPEPDVTVFEAVCGKGTYVRSLARDIGRDLGCLGHVAQLRRTRAGPFAEDGAWTLPALAEAVEGGRDAASLLRPPQDALAGLPSLAVTPADAASIVMGKAVLVRGRDAPVMTGAVAATCKGRLVALGQMEQGAFHPTRVFGSG